MPPRPEVVTCETRKPLTGCGEMVVRVGIVDDKPYEVFINLGKGGVCAYAISETLGKSLSYELQSGGSIFRIVKRLRRVGCPETLRKGDETINTSCFDAVGMVLQNYLTEKDTEHLNKYLEKRRNRWD